MESTPREPGEPGEKGDGRRAGRAALLAGLAVALPLFALLAWHFWFVCDDAYISFRYAKHLALGRGPIFNPGESPPVEGYSNFLWVVWLSLASRLGLELGAAANVTSLACGAALVVLATRLAVRRLQLGPRAAILTAAFLASLPAFAMWSTSGLETMPFALALFCVYERLSLDPERPLPLAAGIAALAAALLRADGAAWAVMVLAAVALEALEHKRIALWRALAVAGVVLLLGVTSHVLWRHSYYGEWLPNTAKVKAGFSVLRLERGARYVAAFALAVPAVLLVPLNALIVRGQGHGTLARQAGLMLLGSLGYALFVGGDFMPFGRFLVPALPFLALLLARLVRALPPLPGTFSAAGLVALGCFASFGLWPVPDWLLQRTHFRWNVERAHGEHDQWAFMKSQAENWSLLGRALARFTQPGESMIRGNIGGTGYYSELVLLDQNGLVTPEVAGTDNVGRASPGHDKRVPPEFFFDRRPTYLGAAVVPLGSPPGRGVLPEQIEHLRSGRARLERHPLPAAEGFPEGLELRLLRLVW